MSRQVGITAQLANKNAKELCTGFSEFFCTADANDYIFSLFCIGMRIETYTLDLFDLIALPATVLTRVKRSLRFALIRPHNDKCSAPSISTIKLEICDVSRRATKHTAWET